MTAAVGRIEDHRHPVMQFRHQRVRRTGEDGAGGDLLTRLPVRPGLPEAREAHGHAVLFINL